MEIIISVFLAASSVEVVTAGAGLVLFWCMTKSKMIIKD